MWTPIGEPPVGGYQIYGYAAIFHSGYHYYFGGSKGGSDELNSILALQEKTWTWSSFGKMKTSREGHGVIFVGDRFMLIGGYGTKKNEACFLKNDQFSCKQVASSLKDYVYYPILYLVDGTYKSC